VAKKTASERKDLADRLAGDIRSAVDVPKTAEKIKNIAFKF
jgi:hypothetical protein